MRPTRANSSLFLCLMLTLAVSVLIPSFVKADAEAPPATSSKVAELVPTSVEDLIKIQAEVKKVLKKVVPCTVGVRVGGASGSGVIISEDGYVLTAGHVSGRANVNCTVIMPDGRRVKAKTLGRNGGIDSGLIKITEEGKWPHAAMGSSAKLKKGQWCISTGHPGGYRRGRTPVVRLGRIQSSNSRTIRTDCTLVGGDSGGPLWDMDGNVIGIHSRIGPSIAFNIHVPVDTYRDTWDRLAKAEVWGTRGIGNNGPYMGVEGDLEADSCKILRVLPGTPAAKAGLKADDVILEFDGKKLAKYADLRPAIRRKKVGEKVPLLVLRDGKEIMLELKLGRRGG